MKYKIEENSVNPKTAFCNEKTKMVITDLTSYEFAKFIKHIFETNDIKTHKGKDLKNIDNFLFFAIDYYSADGVLIKALEFNNKINENNTQYIDVNTEYDLTNKKYVISSSTIYLIEVKYNMNEVLELIQKI